MLTDEQRLEAVREILAMCDEGPKPRLIYTALVEYQKAAKERLDAKKEEQSK
jgi:rRNA processing protein Krr1/Pno1